MSSEHMQHLGLYH